MKNLLLPISLFLLVFSFPLYSQNSTTGLLEEGGDYPAGKNDASNPCITPQQYKLLEKQNSDNCKALGINYRSMKVATTTTFIWPLRTANGLNDCSYYFIGNYVDQDTTSPGIKDWNCGTVTYDGHAGTDICTFPYPFYKMDNDQVEVIAAASGTIVNRVDGNFDKNCAMGNVTANYIVIQHADGSCALYWHMKKNSLTAKQVGQTVVAGEYLGVVGSSGSSTGPHLHFEVLNGITVNTLNDSYSGPCNKLNARSWWITQKPYTEPAIVEASVHPIVAVFPACPSTETPNEDTCFSAGASVRFYIFIRNETKTMIANMRIINPDGSTFTSWTHTSNNTYLSSYWVSTKVLPLITGTYTYEAVYNGITCTKKFKVNCAAMGVISVNDDSRLNVYPNPTNSSITISSSTALGLITMCNTMGEVVYSQVANETQLQIDLGKQPAGMYFLQITLMAGGNIIKRVKIMKD